MLIFCGIKCCEGWEANERRRLLLSSRYSCGGSKYETCQIRIQTQIQIQKLISTNTNEDLDTNTPPITVVLVGYTNGRHLSCLKCNSSPSTIYPLNLKCLPRSLNWKCIPFNCVCAFICTIVHETNVILQFYLENGNYILQPFSGSPAPVTIGEVKISIIWPEK